MDTDFKMKIRHAGIKDIEQIQFVRNAVKENRLSDPGLVTDEDCAHFITERGRGWVWETEGRIAGFAIADLQDNNIWALFVHPDFERQGIGRLLHDTMINWYFAQTDQTLWLGTAPETRAAHFYRKAGWEQTGIHAKNEIKFEMTANAWREKKENR